MNARVLPRPVVAELPAPRALAIVVSYVAGFFVLLPAVLWSLGGAWDARLHLPPAPPLARALGVALVAVGGWGILSSVAALWFVGRGLPMSHLPPLRLVRSGLYRWTRHPLYLAYTLALAGAGLLAESVGRGVLMPAVLTLAWIVYAVAVEEPRLGARHGTAYRAYRESTPLLFVRASTWRALAHGPWRLLRPLLQWLADRPVLWRTGPAVWVTYGAIAAAAAIVTVAMMAGLLAEILPPSQVQAYAIGLALSIIAGARAAWLVYHARVLRESPWATLRTPGFVSWGGYLGLITFTLGFAWWSGVSALDMLDRAFLPAVGCCGLSRLGCLTYGCCYGRPAPWGLCWRRPECKPVRERGAEGAVPRIPSPVFAGLMASAVFAVMCAATTLHPPAGFVTGLGLLLYGLGRFGIDAFRDERRYTGAQLTAGQLGSGIAIVLGITSMLAASGPAAWPRAVGLDAFRPVLGPTVLAAVGLLTCAAYGFHWRRVGRW
jgi:prolipoprotein diacylglyceryltransferase/protein-S-isoprenylcysteine O-methyltransferase Ste14